MSWPAGLHWVCFEILVLTADASQRAIDWTLLRQRVSFQPQSTGGNCWIDAGLPPPRGFITAAVDFAVVTTAQRDSKFVADLTPKRAALCEAEVVSIRGLPAADQTGASGDKLDVIAVANPARLGQRKSRSEKFLSLENRM